jgi:uncharacterized membrane protein (DUF2068 family)
MSTQANATAQGLSAVAVEAPLKRAPTLYFIIFFKLIKGVLFCAFGIALYFQATHDLPAEWDNLLQRPFVGHVFERLRIHPENKFFQHIAEQIANVTQTQVRVWAMGTMLFSLFPLVEGIGMLYRAGWAGWLTIVESAFFVPIEMYELAKKYSPYMLAVMIVNIFIVWYLYANRQALFHHHHKHQAGTIQ